ncbi:hypothetical protein [Imhoffiella purpurea]|uniref:Uncharacterized protein n=1 Tax=Imhoffiella purpurea TaxID=1249627 RepID=W9VJ72_9GAMM|nr:hypothetical protein [Imhoffiella purpurea]EXJ16107.1 hypothetical protein D779_0576 [Imhoffiella purpurea]
MSPESSTEFANARPYTPLDDVDLSLGSRVRLAFLRGIVWSLIGMIYAPLFTGLVLLLEGVGLGYFSYVIAASVAGGVGAVLYGARELALISTGLGAVVGVMLLILLSGQVSLADVALLAAAVAATVGLTVAFPKRCSRHVPGKALAGLATGIIGGAVVAVAEPLHPHPFPIFATLAFVVSVNGVLYVSTVRWWVGLSRRIRLESHPCYLIEAFIMAILAGVAAGSVWMVAGPLLNLGEGMSLIASETMHLEIQQAILGGLFGGGTAGVLLEIFRFRWVHDI